MLNENLLSILEQIRFPEEKHRLRRKAIREGLEELRTLQQEQVDQVGRLDLVDWDDGDNQEVEERRDRVARIGTTLKNAFSALIEAGLSLEADTTLSAFQIPEAVPEQEPELKTSIDLAGNVVEEEKPDAGQLAEHVSELAESLTPAALEDVGAPEASHLDRRFRMPDSTALYNFECMLKRYLELGGIRNPNQLNLRRSSAVQTLISRTLAAAKGVEIETTANMEEMAEVVA